MKRTFSLTLLALASAALADQPPHGTWTDARIAGLVVYTSGGPQNKGYVVVTLQANGTGSPSCAAGYPRSVAVDLTVEGSRMALGELERSMLMGQSITLTGSGACTVQATVETLASVESKSPR